MKNDCMDCTSYCYVSDDFTVTESDKISRRIGGRMMLLIFQVLLLFSMFVFLVGSYSKGEFSNKIPLIMFIFTSVLFLFTVVVL